MSQKPNIQLYSKTNFNSAWEVTRYLPFNVVLAAYKSQGIFQSPLLEPANKIESRLKESGILLDNEHLSRYIESSESFEVMVWKEDENKSLPLLKRFKLWLIKHL